MWQRGGGEDEVSYGDSNLGGWSQNFFGRPDGYFITRADVYNTVGYFITPEGILQCLRMFCYGCGYCNIRSDIFCLFLWVKSDFKSKKVE